MAESNLEIEFSIRLCSRLVNFGTSPLHIMMFPIHEIPNFNGRTVVQCFVDTSQTVVRSLSFEDEGND